MRHAGESPHFKLGLRPILKCKGDQRQKAVVLSFMGRIKASPTGRGCYFAFPATLKLPYGYGNINCIFSVSNGKLPLRLGGKNM